MKDPTTGPEIVKVFNQLAIRVGWNQVKKFRTLADARRRLAAVKTELNGRNPRPKSATAARREKDEAKKIVILKSQGGKHQTKADGRFIELMKLEAKTVKSYLDLMVKRGMSRGRAMSDLKWWIKYGRIKFE